MNRIITSVLAATLLFAGSSAFAAASLQDCQATMAKFKELVQEQERLMDEIERWNQELEQRVQLKSMELENAHREVLLTEKLAALGHLSAGMAHEIRNPLGAVQLYASLLERDLEEQGNGDVQWARKISMAVGSLDTIVNDILTFTHDQDCQKGEVVFGELLGEVMDLVEPRVWNKQVEIDVSGVEEELLVNVDYQMMRRVLLNLLLKV